MSNHKQIDGFKVVFKQYNLLDENKISIAG